MRHRLPSDPLDRYSKRFVVIGLLVLTIGCGAKDVAQQSNPDTSATKPRSVAKPVLSKGARLNAIRRKLVADQLGDAESEIQALLIEDPDNIEINKLLIQQRQNQNRYEEAIAILDRIALLDRNQRDELQRQAAEIAFKSGDIEASLNRFAELLKRSPEFDEARHRYAEILDQRGFSYDANQQVRRLYFRTSTTQNELLGLVFPTRAWTSRRDVDSITPEKRRSLGDLTVVNALRIHGNPRKALELIQQSKWYSSKNPAAIALCGRVLATAQQYEELSEWLTTSPKECERYPDFWIAAGSLANQVRDPAAIGCFAEAIRREPNLMDANYGMVHALEIAGENVLAGKFRENLAALDAISADVKLFRESSRAGPQQYVELSARLMAMGRGIEAIAWQELAIQKGPRETQMRQAVQKYKQRIQSELPTGVDEQITLCGLTDNHFLNARKWIDSQRSRKLTPEKTPEQAPSFDLPEIADVPRFANVASQVGIDFQYKNAAIPVGRHFRIFEGFGGGVGCLDYDRDGQIDLYFAQADTSPPNQRGNQSNAMYRNLVDRFSLVTESTDTQDHGYSTGIAAGDWNQDGFADLLVCSIGPNRLLVNQGDGTFREHLDPSISAGPDFTSSAAIADVTGDGLPDIVEVNYVDDPSAFEAVKTDSKGDVILPGPLNFDPAPDRLLVSNGDGTAKAQPLGKQTDTDSSAGLGVLVGDLDLVNGNEIFVANDLYANHFWIRNTDGAWSNQAVLRGIAYGQGGKPNACMGIAAADFDRNGRIDLHITNFEDEWSNHYMQTDTGIFIDSVAKYKLDVISQQMLGFGTQAVDYNNDSVWDLFVGNGHVEDLTAKGKAFAMPTQVLAAVSGGFEQQSVQGDPEYWNGKHFSRAMAKLDWNRDGLVDVVINDLKEPSVLLENRTKSSNHWIQFELVGNGSSREPIGARVEVEFGGKRLMHSLQAGDGYMATNQRIVCFGIGDAIDVEKVSVQWPSGTEQSFRSMSADRRWIVVEGDDQPWNDSIMTR